MAVEWAETFSRKHLVVVEGSSRSLQEMVKEGIRIFRERKDGRHVDTYGKQRPSEEHGNTVVITTRAGFLAMGAWVETNGRRGAKQTDNHIPVKIGAIVSGKDLSRDSVINTGGGTIHVQIEVSGPTKRVMHLGGWHGSESDATLTGHDVAVRKVGVTSALGGTDATVGHFKSLNEIIRNIDSYVTGV